MKKDSKTIPTNFKVANGQIKNVDTKKRIVQAYGSKFGNIDAHLDMIVPGAFTKTITENGPAGKNRIFHLWQHKTDAILGKPTLIKEDSYGLYFESEIVDTTLGDDVLKLYEAGIINEHSIGYNVIKWEDHEDHYKLTEIRLYEISAVTWGANPETPTVGMKNEKTAGQILDELSRVKSLMKNGNLKHEESYFLLDNIFTNLETQIKALIKEPQTSTPNTIEPHQLDSLFNSFFKHFN